MIEKAAPGWSELMLVALRTDPAGGARAVGAALLDEEALAEALRRAGVADDEDERGGSVRRCWPRSPMPDRGRSIRPWPPEPQLLAM
jgi:hypothetical protein